MAEYIEREEAMHIAFKSPFFSDALMEEMKAIPAADVAPVRHGRWMCHGDCGVTECSVCGWSIEEYVGDYAYCPNCGARMDGGAE